MSFAFRRSIDEEYQLMARLQGMSGPINCLAFSTDGRYLASGADDEKLRIWDIEAKRSYYTIKDSLERWGQITCIKWLSRTSDDCDRLCFGTGRGLVLLYREKKNG
ncbi:hypothetical protein BDN70DRAFT_901824, partial [Pholiota conissans]